MELKNTLIKYLLPLFLTSVCQADNYQEAGQKALEAWYSQSETRNIVEYKLEILKEKAPKELKKTVEIILPIVDTLIKQRVEVTYDF